MSLHLKLSSTVNQIYHFLKFLDANVSLISDPTINTKWIFGPLHGTFLGTAPLIMGIGSLTLPLTTYTSTDMSGFIKHHFLYYNLNSYHFRQPHMTPMCLLIDHSLYLKHPLSPSLYQVPLRLRTYLFEPWNAGDAASLFKLMRHRPLLTSKRLLLTL